MDFQEAIEKKIKYYEKECQYPLAKAEGDAFEELCAFYLENGPWGEGKRGSCVEVGERAKSFDPRC